MNVDMFGNELNVGDEVAVFYEHIFQNDAAVRPGVLRYIDENKRTARVRYHGARCDLAIDKKCVVLASDPRVSILLLQM